MAVTQPHRVSKTTAATSWRMVRAFALVGFIVLAGASMVQAQSLILGVGQTRFSYDAAEDYPIFSVEYQHKSFKTMGRWNFGVGGALSVDTNRDTLISVGLYAIYDAPNRWFVETSVMPGLYFNGSQDNRLGGLFEIRSLLALGYEVDDRNSISLAITHVSNASTSDFNPGVNALWLRWHRKF